LRLPAAAPRQGALTLGVRPEHAALDAGGAWALQVEMLEMLGAERLVYGKLGSGGQGAAFTLRIEATLAPPKPGDAVRLSVRPEHLHWYDSRSGQRV
jgi:sn-glycerol 3-phosphate transport system ATP-binding protein